MMENEIELTNLVPQTPHDSPLSGGHTPGSDEGSITLKELTDLCITLSQRVLDLEKFKTAQAKEIVIVEDKGSGKKGGSTAEIVSAARPDISTARPEVSIAAPKTPPITTTLFDDEDITIADTLIKMKSLKAKEKGVAFKDADNSARPIRSITTLQPLPTIDPKDKGKGILQEPEPVKKTKKRDQDQIKRDAKVALKIQADLDEEVRIEKERQKEASKAALAKLYDEVQSQINADHELPARLTYTEQEKYIVEERSKFLAEFFERRKKQLAKERAEVLKKMKKELEVEGKEQQVVPDDDKAINYEILDVKSPIVDCESQVLGNMEIGDVNVYKLTRLDGSYKHFSTFSTMLKVLDRQDVLDLHKIVMKRFPANDTDGYDLILWGDMKTLMESSEDAKI
nr:hypothetical protein [Tanacetum cinerariifolium]